MNWTGSFRTIWVSDLHLGTRSSQAERFLDFLRSTESDYLYLVDDIVDGWALRRNWYWPQTHNDVIQKLLRKARRGTQVVYIPGNHDEFARHFLQLQLGGIEIERQKIHRTARLELLDGSKKPAWAESDVAGDGAFGSTIGISWVCHCRNSSTLSD